MERYFREAKKFLDRLYPELYGNISGDLYPPPLFAQYFARFVGYLWTIGIVLIVAGSQIFKILNIPEPEYVKVITENKGSAFLVLFVLNNVANSMLATGAFEIYLDDVLIFSKIATGRFPSVEDLQSALRQHGLFPA
eukprot:gene332-355_t